MNETKTDQRRMVLVTLEATDDAEHYQWKCPRCQNPIIELVNLDYVGISDVFDPTNPAVGSIGTKCGGRLQEGGKCRVWYYFSLSVRPSA